MKIYKLKYYNKFFLFESYLLNKRIETKNKLEILKEHNIHFDLVFDNILKKYAKLEIDSFNTKFLEATKVKNNPDTSINETPFLSILSRGDIQKRNELAFKILDKVDYLGKIELMNKIYRDYILYKQTQNYYIIADIDEWLKTDMTEPLSF